MADGLGKGGGIEPLADRSKGDSQSLTRDEVRILKLITVILAVRCLAEEQGVTSQELKDAVDAPAVQRVRVAAFPPETLGNW